MNFVSSMVAPAKLDFLTVMRSCCREFFYSPHAGTAPWLHALLHAKPGRAVRTMGGAHILDTLRWITKEGGIKVVRSPEAGVTLRLAELTWVDGKF